MNVNIKKLNDNATIPTRGTKYSAGMDLYACIEEPVVIEPHKTVMVDTGLAMEIPEGYFGAIYPRSGLSTKRGIVLANNVAVIDSDYRGEIKLPLHNHGTDMQVIEPHERVAQLIIQPYLPINWNIVDELNDTDRGDKGFGDSGRF